jgi:hypothetical protein
MEKEITKVKCEKCLGMFDPTKDVKACFNSDNTYKIICVECYNKQNAKPFMGIDEIKKHKWYITWQGYQDEKGKVCQWMNCGNTKYLLDLSADKDTELGGIICSEHVKQGGFKLIGDWSKSWEKTFELKT